MKNTDIAMIILIASLSVGGAYGIVSVIPGLKLDENDAVTVKIAERYTSSLEKVDPAVFNSDAINPTVDVTIGGTSASKE